METAGELADWTRTGQGVDFVYPGKVFWSNDLNATRLGDFGQIPGRPKVTATIVPKEAVIDPVTVDFNADDARDYFTTWGKITKQAQAGDVTMTFAAASSVESAALGVGLSVSGWGQSLKANFNKSNNNSSTFLLFRIDAITHNAALNPMPSESWLPDACLFENAKTVDRLLPLAPGGGAPVIVNSVRYGRMILIGLWTSEDQEEIQRDVQSKNSGWGVKTTVKLADKKNKDIKHFGVTLVSVGIAPDKVEFSKLLDPGEIDLESLSKLLNDQIKTVAEGAGRNPSVVSFTTQFLDGSPHRVHEATQFTADRFSPRQQGYPIPDIAIETSPKDVYDGTGPRWKNGGDTEINFNDCTLVAVNYSVEISRDKRDVLLNLAWTATEADGNCRADKKDGDYTFFKSKKQFTLWRLPRALKGYQIQEIVGLANLNGRYEESVQRKHLGSREACWDFFALSKTANGHGPDNVGNLEEVMLQVDSYGKGDDMCQRFKAVWKGGAVSLSEPKPDPIKKDAEYEVKGQVVNPQRRNAK